MDEDYANILEWAVWANLDRQDNIDLLILKGHLTLGIFIENVLLNHTTAGYSNWSFSRKIKEFKTISAHLSTQAEIAVGFLMNLNDIRNQLAHEWEFSAKASGIEHWANEVLSSIPGMKHSKFTHRTRIVHAFSALTKTIIEIERKL